MRRTLLLVGIATTVGCHHPAPAPSRCERARDGFIAFNTAQHDRLVGTLAGTERAELEGKFADEIAVVRARFVTVCDASFGDFDLACFADPAGNGDRSDCRRVARQMREALWPDSPLPGDRPVHPPAPPATTAP